MATPSGSRVKVKPPERGVFALDHEGECKNEMKVYCKTTEQMCSLMYC